MISKGKLNQQKGGLTEEILATYFRKAGYFVVRGVPFEYGGYSVTDIDLWLYIRSSSVSREVAIVDIKKKKTPQAIERIFWTKGLQAAVGANHAIVATTDSRQEVVSFGKKLGVTVLGGKFLSKLTNADKNANQRLSNEEFLSSLNNLTLGKLDGDWKGRITASKQELTQGLSFNSINLWLDHGNFFAQQVITRPTNSDLAIRALLQIISYIAIGLDYRLKDLSFEDSSEKHLALKSGFTYGSGGQKEIMESIDHSLELLNQFSGLGIGQIGNIKFKVQKAFENLPTEILSEFFSNSAITRGLVDIAKEFDAVSMNRQSPFDIGLSLQARAIIGCLLDFWGIDRKTFGLNKLNTDKSPQ